MKLFIILLSLLLTDTSATAPSFRDQQKKYTRVQEAYAGKEKVVLKNLQEHNISRDSLRIYLRSFKVEKLVELWAKNISDSVFTLIKVFPICDISGDVGPKRRYKDLQVPEGFYHISGINPFSKYYLSMQVNYPNASDSIRGVKGRLGNFIFIHGECISSGCIAITNERIKELYIYGIEAYNSGQEIIDITMFPAKLTDATYAAMVKRYSKYKDDVSLWGDLKKAWDLFEKTKQPPHVNFLPDGTHEVY
jgi:murein L,D-transpeptidase YafK